MNKEIEIEKIVLMNRKTIYLQITSDAKLVVKAPFNTDNKKIVEIVEKHRKWIEKKKKELLERKFKHLPKQFVEGEQFLFLGNSYPLTLVDNKKGFFKLDEKFYLSKDLVPYAKEVFIFWYRRVALTKISERVKFYADKRFSNYGKINITRAKRRWGSCSPKGNLSFSWRLILAPLTIVDYVVVHELVHLEERNHSKQFWNKVKEILPDYEDRRKWLKTNGNILELQ
jgi:predicted metal-dependent hydrolase